MQLILNIRSKESLILCHKTDAGEAVHCASIRVRCIQEISSVRCIFMFLVRRECQIIASEKDLDRRNELYIFSIKLYLFLLTSITCVLQISMYQLVFIIQPIVVQIGCEDRNSSQNVCYQTLQTQY